MTDTSATESQPAGGIFSPLKEKTFRNIWIGGSISNTGGQIQAVAAAWVMATISTADHVALVQTASFLPIALLSLPAGAIADVYDRRKVQIFSLSFAMVAAAAMMAASLLGLITPWALLGFCFLVGVGQALATPARGASVAEQVPKAVLTQAVALHNISYNIARSAGPALGGMIVAAFGAATAFIVNATTFLPALEALRRWRRKTEVSRLPPEGFGRSIRAGVRYVYHMRLVRRVILRVFFAGLFCSALQSLLPLVARDLLDGDATVYGLLLGFFGIGSVSGIFVLQQLRRFLGNENAFRLCNLVMALSLLVISLSRNLLVDLVILLFAGVAWMMTTTIIAITVQLNVPRWVLGRAIGVNTAAITLGIALGSWMWGEVASESGLVTTFQIAAAVLVLSMLLGRFLPVPDREASTEPEERILHDPEVKLGVSGRSGPIRVELHYRIPSEKARDFYHIMRKMRRARIRSGAYDWSLSRNIADPELWSEFFSCPTWNDYLRLRTRPTIEDMAIFEQARAMHIGIEPIKVMRWLGRPSGSVRWREDAPDRGDDPLRIEG